MFLHLDHCIGIDQRSQCSAGLKPVADLHFANGCGEFFSKGIIDAGLHVDPVGANAGLAIVAKLAHDRTFNGGIKICIIKYDKRGVAAQLH